MDSAQDTSLQQVGSSYLFRQASDFCENPFCLGEGWHTWGSCSNPGTNRFDTAEQRQLGQTQLLKVNVNIDMGVV